MRALQCHPAISKGVLLAGALAFPTCAEEIVVPVRKAPFHLFTFEDENMSLENVTLPPGMSTRYHSHDQDLVFVVTAGAKITNQVLGKEPGELVDEQWKRGEGPAMPTVIIGAES
jgi:hypothetical protein